MIRFRELPKVDIEAPKLMRVRPGPPLEVKLCNKKYVGLDTHYWGGHTIHCPGEETCKACGDGMVAIFSGFIFVQLWTGGRVALLALTPVMCATLTMANTETGNLLGMKCRFRRKSKAVNSGVVTSVHGFDSEIDAMSGERLVTRVRIIFKDYVIQAFGPDA
jgi:hypothetical protein